MKSPLKPRLVSLGLCVLGLLVWYSAGASLQREGLHVAEPNVFCLKGSPFGKTIAMAMQGPVDVHWHEGETHDHLPVSTGDDHGDCGHDHGDCGHDHHHDHGTLADNHSGCGGCAGCDQLPSTAGSAPETNESAVAVSTAAGGHGPEDGCAGCAGCKSKEAAATVAQAATDQSLRERMLGQIREWRAVANTRHNPHANSEIHRELLRRQVERKLLLTYQMDPTNYFSYGAYFLFLSETSLSDRPESIAHALRLSQVTVQHCLQDQESATALLTGAAAAHDAAQLLQADDSAEARDLAGRYMKVAREMLQNFEHTALQMAFDGSWENFSPLRQQEMTERARLLRKLVENSGSGQHGINANHGEDHQADTAG